MIHGGQRNLEKGDFRLVRGSLIERGRLWGMAPHIIWPRRFVVPQTTRTRLVEAWRGAPDRAAIDNGKIEHLVETIARYFTFPTLREDIVWTFSGIRPLYDDSAGSASAVTRDYVLDVHTGEGFAAVLTVFGGKITTYRKLAEHALNELAPFVPGLGPAWTSGARLPGGDMPDGDFERYLLSLIEDHPALPPALLPRLARAYGTQVVAILAGAATKEALGADFGGGLYAREVDYLVEREWARTAEDILFRRSKPGLHVPASTASRLDAYLAAARAMAA